MDVLISRDQCEELTRIVETLGEKPRVTINGLELTDDLAEAIIQTIALVIENDIATISNGDRNLTVEEAGEILGLSQASVIGMMKSGEIPATLIEGEYAIRLFDLQGALAQIKEAHTEAFEN